MATETSQGNEAAKGRKKEPLVISGFKAMQERARSFVRETRDHRLLKAVEKGDVKGARKALESGADPNSKDTNGEILFNTAVKSGNLEICKAFLDNGADPNNHTEYGLVPIQHAMIKRDSEMCKLLLERGAKIPGGDQINEILFLAVTRGDEELFRDMVSRGADVNCHLGSRYALMYAAEQGQAEMCKILIDGGADPDRMGTVSFGKSFASNMNALRMAKRSKDKETIRMVGLYPMFRKDYEKFIDRFEKCAKG